MNAYYQQLNRSTQEDGTVITHYKSTIHAQGAWNENEQHMAPATGIICAELEQFQPREEMRIGRISLDIFGLIAFGEFEITTKTIRPGKTIELIEATMSAQGKTCIVARAWRMLMQNSQEIAALEDAAIAQPEQYQPWEGMKRWPGGFIQTLEIRNNPELHRNGKGIVWATSSTEMVADQNTSDFVRLMGIIDISNGIAPRLPQLPLEWSFPNLDLQVHMHRLPQGKWVGLEAIQQYGHDGIGLTSTILHDIYGPFGRSEQILTIRKI